MPTTLDYGTPAHYDAQVSYAGLEAVDAGSATVILAAAQAVITLEVPS